MRRYENRSTMMTRSRPSEDWAKLIGDVAAATASVQTVSSGTGAAADPQS